MDISTVLHFSEGEDCPGLEESRVADLRLRYGYNEFLPLRENLFALYVKNFWGPLPWLMELLIILSFFSGQKIEGGIILFLLIINSLVSMLQRHSADAALAILTKSLGMDARVKRNGAWKTLPTRELLPGDIIRVRAGDVVPADVEILQGNISADLSSLTGESMPKEESEKDTLFSGSMVKRGEATARVTAIGSLTAYGKTTELLETDRKSVV